MSPTFLSVLLSDQRFPRCHTFYNSALTTMLNCQKGKQNAKESNIQFRYFFNNIGTDPPFEYTCILGANLVCVVEVMSFETFNHKKKKKMAKIQNLKFHNSLSIFGEPLPRSMHDFWE